MQMNADRKLKGEARLTTTGSKTKANKSQFMIVVVSLASRMKRSLMVGEMFAGPLGLLVLSSYIN